VGGAPYAWQGEERIADVIAPLSGSEGRPTAASVITILNANSDPNFGGAFALPGGAPANAILAIRSITPAPTPTAYGTPISGWNWVGRLRWHAEIGGRLTQFGTLAADVICPIVLAGGQRDGPDLISLLAKIAADFPTPAGAQIVIDSIQQSANRGNYA
jgi:hypothetical protein